MRIHVILIFPDPELFVSFPDPARMKEHINSNCLSNFRPVDSGLYRYNGKVPLPGTCSEAFLHA